MDRFDSDPEVRKALLELAAEACLTLDPFRRVRSFSTSLARLFGYEAEELAGLPIDALLPDVNLAAHLDPTGGARLAPLEDVAAQVSAQHKGGRRFAVQVRTRAVLVHGERVVVVIVQPIGAAEAGLRESQEMLRAVVDSTTACIYIKDAESRYILINRRFEELFHVTNQQIQGRTDADLFPPEVVGQLRENDSLVRQSGKPTEFDETVTVDGEPRQYISIKVPLIDPSGVVYGVCGISTDITDRKRREEQLVEAYKHLQALVADRTSDLSELSRLLQEQTAARQDVVLQLSSLIAAANEGIWTVDKERVTTFVNPRMAEMLGYGPDDMVGRPMANFLAESAQVELDCETSASAQAAHHELELRCRDGSSVWALVSCNPIRDRGGRAVGTLCMVTDITDRKHAEQYRIQLVRELDHRVKNSLATVVALADLLMANASSLAEFRLAFGERMQALARTHEALADARWQDIAFDSVVEVVLKAQRAVAPGRVSLSGESVELAPRIITPLALTLSELGTNALKHGALSRTGGEVRVAWRRTGEGRFELVWSEHGGPPVEAPAVGGTGLELLRGLIEYELGGEVSLAFDPKGVSCRIDIPLDASSMRSRGPREPSARGHAGSDRI